MAQCKKCVNSSDCWIKQVINCRVRMPDSPRDQDLCIKASLGNCVMYEPREACRACPYSNGEADE